MALAAGTRLTAGRLKAMTNVAVALRADGIQSIAQSTIVTLAMDVVVFDTDGMADLTNNQLVIKTAGIYALKAGVRINPTDGVRVQMRFNINGVPFGLSDLLSPSGTDGYITTYDAQLVVGDVVQAAFYQEGVAVSTSPASGMPFLSAARVAGDVT